MATEGSMIVTISLRNGIEILIIHVEVKFECGSIVEFQGHMFATLSLTERYNRQQFTVTSVANQFLLLDLLKRYGLKKTDEEFV